MRYGITSPVLAIVQACGYRQPPGGEELTATYCPMTGC